MSSTTAGGGHDAGAAALAVLARHGRSFHFASRLLDRATARSCARLYAFCRTVDDIADRATVPADAVRHLEAVRQDVARGASDVPWVADFLDLSAQSGIDRQAAIVLIDAVAGDLEPVALADEAALLRYAYGVAGTVGLMMCPLLGARTAIAARHAIDLGIAMQLSNIARDVAEDARAGRRYLPASLVGEVAPATIAAAPEGLQPLLRGAVRAVLARAEQHYESAEDGIAHLAPRARPAILVAARVYRSIGRRIAAADFATWQGRTVVPARAKFAIAGRALWDLARQARYRNPRSEHDPSLHRCLVGLPGANAQHWTEADHVVA